MKLLLHTCCAPCAIYPIKAAGEDGYDSITGLFYNPNIHPRCEFEKRLAETRKVFDPYLVVPEYRPYDYFGYITDFEIADKRCAGCWNLRLRETASLAKEKGFDAFTTTLLASPYQNHDVLKGIAEQSAAEYGVGFYYRDFRSGFRQGHSEAKAKGIYCQNYCGCVFSIVEREEVRKRRRIGRRAKFGIIKS